MLGSDQNAGTEGCARHSARTINRFLLRSDTRGMQPHFPDVANPETARCYYSPTIIGGNTQGERNAINPAGCIELYTFV